MNYQAATTNPILTFFIITEHVAKGKLVEILLRFLYALRILILYEINILFLLKA
jgi:hypothetical protein